MELASNQVRVFIIKAFFFRISLFVSPLIFGFILKAFLNVQATNDDAVSDFADILASTLRVEQYITPYWKVMDARCALCDHFLYSFFLWNFISLFFFVTVSGYFFPFSLFSVLRFFASQDVFLLFAFLFLFLVYELVFRSLMPQSFSRVSLFLYSSYKQKKILYDIISSVYICNMSSSSVIKSFWLESLFFLIWKKFSFAMFSCLYFFIQ